MSEVSPIDVEHRVIVHMQKLMYDGMFHVLLIEKIPLAEHDCTGIWRKTTRMCEVARQAGDVDRCDVCTSQLDMLEHELD